MPQPEKNIIFPHGTTGLLDIIFRVHRDRDDYLLDNDDGIFKETPVGADISAVEDPDNAGVYLHNEDRVDWEFENDVYTVYAYQTGVLIGQGKLKLHYGRGSATLDPISGAGGAAPLPAGASTSAKQDVVIAALGGSPNYYSNDKAGEETTSSTTFALFTTIVFGFTTRGITLQNTSDENIDFSWDGTDIAKTLEPGDELAIPVAITQLDAKSASGGKTFKATAV